MTPLAFVLADEGLGGIVPFGRALVNLGISPVLLVGPAPEQRLAEWRAVYPEVVVLDDPYDPDAVAGTAHALACGRPIAALFSCYDGLCLTSAVVAEKLCLPHPGVGGLARSRNKVATRSTTLAHGLATPRFASIDSVEACAAGAEAVGFPGVLKPLNGMASHLVRRVESLEELRQTYLYITDRLTCNFAGNYARGLAASGLDQPDPLRTLLLEEFLTGDEYSAEVIVRGGKVHRIALFHKFMVESAGFLECGFTRPSFGRDHRSDEIWIHIEQCLQAVGVDDAAAHVEVIDTADGPRLVEINAGRAGGQILVLAVRLATGVDLITEILALALGRERPAAAAPELHDRVTTFTVFPPASGRLDALTGLDRLAALPRVTRVVPLCRPGDVLDIDDKEVFAVNFLAHGGEEAELRALYQRARRAVRFAMSSVPAGHDGQRVFAPTTTVAALLSRRQAQDASNGRTKVAGRVKVTAANQLALSDGESVIPVQLRDAPSNHLVRGSWAGVEGRWDPVGRALGDGVMTYLRPKAGLAAGNAGRRVPECAYLSHPEQLEAVRMRSRLVAWLRAFCEREGFLEVQTPFLHAEAETANVHQYRIEGIGGRTFYIRTDPEEYLKRYLTAGLEAVYEIAANVRAEAPDADRLHEFTSLECYRRFGTLETMISLCTELVRGALAALRGRLTTELHGAPLAWEAAPSVRTVRELISEHSGIDIDEYPTAAALASAVRVRGWWEGSGTESDTLRGNWLEWLVEHRVAPALEVPTYVVDFPIELGLSACPRAEKPGVCLRAELYLPGGWELAHLYENLTEPRALAERLAERRRRRLLNGYPDVPIDGGLLASAELGMPPMAGLAIGVDRLLMLVLGHDRVGSGLLFAREGFAEVPL